VSCPLPRFALALAFSLVVVTLTPTAHAEDPKVETNYSAGKAALKGGKLDDALTHFKTALSLSKGDEGRTWQMLLAIALTYKERAEPHHAIEYYRRFLKQTEADQDMMQVKWKRRREMASRDLAEVELLSESTHGFVPVKSTPPGAKLFVNGKPGGADGDAVSPFGLILPAGTHTIGVQLKGYKPFERTVSVRAGGAHPLKVTLEFIVATPPPAAATPKPQVSEPASAEPAMPTVDVALTASAGDEEAGSPLGAWITIGAGGAAAIAAVAMSAMASSEQKALEEIERTASDTLKLDPTAETALDGQQLSDEWDAIQGRRDTYQMVGGVLYGVAIAAAAGGVIWLLVAEPDEAPPAAAFGLTPTPGGAYGHATWRF
jgi:tetratricopeptide (TPR) repeat protein